MRRHSLQHDRGPHFEVQPFRHAHQALFRHDGKIGVSARDAGPGDGIAFLQGANPVAHACHGTGAFQAKGVWQGIGVRASALVDVNVIQTTGRHFYQHLTIAGRGGRNFLVIHRFRAAELVDTNCFHKTNSCLANR